MRNQWVQALVDHGKDSSSAQRAVDKVSVGDRLVASRASVQVAVDRHQPPVRPPTDTLLLSVPFPTIRPGSVASSGRAAYYGLKRIGHGGFGEVFQGNARMTGGDKPVALKRALPSDKPGTDIEKHLDQQIRRLNSLQREAQVYFSPTFNTGDCLHLALLHDVAQVRNSDGDSEPLLVMNWADGPGNTLSGWLRNNCANIATTIEDRLSFAVQMFAGLRELHYGSGSARTTTPLFVHQDLKPDNILLFGGGEGDGGPVRLALTDFGLTVQYNVDRRDTVHRVGGGTPFYMSPEQWLHLPALSPGRDLWAAGMVLAHLFGGIAILRAVVKYQCYVKQNGE